MTEVEGKKGGVALPGREIDAALGDVIRGILVKPADALGDLLSDGIGLLGDKIKRKREFNMKLGIEEVRKKLEAANVDMTRVTPPKEEELQLLMNGLSLTDDKDVRDMWAGLFAKALEPGSQIKADKPFLVVLQSLTASDARILAFLAYVVGVENGLRVNARSFKPANWSSLTLEEQGEMSVVQKENSERRERGVRAIELKARELDLVDLSDGKWSENLTRLGIIERTPLVGFQGGSLRIGAADLSEVLGDVSRKLEFMDKSMKRSSSPPKRLYSRNLSQIQLEVRLTSFGERLIAACGLLT